jgi:hypothetical protein
MNIFERLLRLYKLNSKSGKTPLEDYMTEVLAGVLESNPTLLDSFVRDVLRVEGTNYRVSSQEYYSLANEPNCIIDLVFKNEDTICFLENKVLANEGYRQLDRYSTVLANLEKETGKRVCLRYCTKMYDPKVVENIDFYQFRWQQVYEFMEKQEESEMIIAFKDLLRRENMAGTSDFNVGDLVVLKGMMESISKMDEVLDMVYPTFSEYFGEPQQRDYPRLKQIPKFNRYSMWTVKKVRSHQLEVMVGFEFDHIEENMAPILFVQIWCYDEVTRQLIKPIIHLFDCNDLEDEGLAWFEEPLSNFLSKEKQKEQMVEWFITQMGEVKGILERV